MEEKITTLSRLCELAREKRSVVINIQTNINQRRLFKTYKDE